MASSRTGDGPHSAVRFAAALLALAAAGGLATLTAMAVDGSRRGLRAMVGLLVWALPAMAAVVGYGVWADPGRYERHEHRG
ncbi:hypothetical protein [Kitasatospora sp. GP82]|uniref:hypothetical protein n=1 Tax=Kitasatospora sp. GP82 TaxID=3035089 RepID=UPI002474B785|nr:hypothetical protein [Kitasatospora sp. GP82]MDH6126171.1 hypothetical protein [Kitasatospora sp. GP82]